MRCPQCGREHLLLEPAFRRPDVVIALSTEERGRRVMESDDMCFIGPGMADEHPRFFLRTVLPVRMTDVDGDTEWGIWVEVAERDAKHALELWDDPKQVEEPAFAGSIANRIKGYPDTTGLPVRVQLTGPSTRPRSEFAPTAAHPLVNECRAGVTTQKVIEWLGEEACRT